MIFRAGALLLLLYALGFALFGVTLGEPAGAEKTDSVVVLTGGPGRIERGVEVMREGAAKRMLVAGADPSVTRADLRRRLGAKSASVLRCCVELGSESVDTRSNAEEAGRWLERRGYRSLRLITSDWHMRRAEYEFRRHLSSRYTVVPDGVRTKPRLTTLFGEYNKYLLRRLAVLLDM
ncbi:MAG: YdcF-like protein [uncultured Sphingomonas sp.]|uniref:YdcF-like protein n=1 Tax=uncultured Sphingomonas sp. TaxID=158754 RepID=A0A6J4SSN0_9SPHN|nr:YdcF family protein [uncultured Sphingomonas sp.]CAA9504218.1 MAG: YdcF-like protein [uncultured Sphingomonas sp.]